MGHRWSGWPGAWCLDCGQADGMELAIAHGDFDPYRNEWVNPEVKAEYQRQYPWRCPSPGSNEFNPYAQ